MAEPYKHVPVLDTAARGSTDTFGEWRDVQREHFGEGGVFDLIYAPRR